MMMVSNLAFQIKPIPVRKQHTKRDDLSGHHLAHGVEIAAAVGKIRYPRRVPFLSAMPNRIETHAQTWFRPSLIHDWKPS